jgi:hypothetical protein
MIPDTGQHNSSYSDAVYLLCDGQGGCKGPTFNCGTGGPCTLSASIACCNQTFQNPVTSCTDKTIKSCFAGGNDSNESCKDTLDCPSGLICCKVQGAGFNGLFCEASCTDSSGNIPVVLQACDLSRGGTCPAGQTCHDFGNGEGTCS